MLRESILIIPKRDNDGRDLSALRDSIAGELCDSFGGVTMRDAQGAWKGPEGKLFCEAVTELVSACEPSGASESILRRLADRINSEGNQFCTYCRFPDGRVEIIERESAMVKLAA